MSQTKRISSNLPESEVKRPLTPNVTYEGSLRKIASLYDKGDIVTSEDGAALWLAVTLPKYQKSLYVIHT